jgi:hypothetical protein
VNQQSKDCHSVVVVFISCCDFVILDDSIDSFPAAAMLRHACDGSLLQHFFRLSRIAH